jgi:hypothetical protein
MKYHSWKRFQVGKWFRFLQWSTQKGSGRLSPYAMMALCGFIMAHGRELRIYHRLLLPSAPSQPKPHELFSALGHAEKRLRRKVPAPALLRSCRSSTTWVPIFRVSPLLRSLWNQTLSGGTSGSYHRPNRNKPYAWLIITVYRKYGKYRRRQRPINPPAMLCATTTPSRIERL